MEKLKFYIDGAWVDPAVPSTLGIVNPATEERSRRSASDRGPMWIGP
jgi:aldehyde dehydrogenase (NAD+)